MTDHLVSLPGAWQYLNQFASSKQAPKPSLMLCGETSTAMAAEFAYPGRYNASELVYDLCLKWAGADVASNPQGSTIEQIKDWLAAAGIGAIDMQPLVDEFAHGNKDPLRLELGAMNRQNVAQILTVADEAYLFQAVPNPHYDAADPSSMPYVRGPRLHNWVDAADPQHTVYHHVIFRVGYSDSAGYGLYAEPAAPAFCVNAKGQFEPVKILWSDIEAAGVMHAIAIMPHGVGVPPQGFEYRTGTWPEPAKAPLDYSAIEADLTAYKQQMDAERAANDAHINAERLASDARIAKILAELAAH